MSRELKFRAWDGEQMVSPDYITRTGVAYWKENSIPCATEQVMQYTGLKDKNGVDIYEGDVLKLISSGFQTPSYNGKVFIRTISFCEGSFITIQKHENGISDEINYLSASTHFEVIGNIHQNPELL